jgi:hypothetical protein
MFAELKIIIDKFEVASKSANRLKARRQPRKQLHKAAGIFID